MKHESCRRKLYHYIKELDPSFPRILIIQSIVVSLISFFNPVMTTILLNLLIEESDMIYVWLAVIGMTVGNFMLSILRTWINRKETVREFQVCQNYTKKKTESYFKIGYEMIESSEFEDLRQGIRFRDESMGTFRNVINNFKSLYTGIVTLLVSIAFLGSMLVHISSLNHHNLIAFLIGVIIMLILIRILILTVQKIQNHVQKVLPQLFGHMTTDNRLAMYLAERVVYDYQMGKDIRIYQITSMIEKEFVKMIDSMKKIYRKISIVSSYGSGMNKISSGILTGAVFIYMVVLANAGYIAIGNIVLYTDNVNKLVSQIVNVFFVKGEFAVLLSKLEEAEKLFTLAEEKKEQQISKKEVKVIKNKNHHSIRFSNVWFRYPGVDEWVLKDINFVINDKEKVAIVGENGAGKSTAIKLLCGLYQPTKGQIFIDDYDIQTIPSDQYKNFMAVVFQDFKLFSMSLKDNIILTNKYEEEKFIHTLQKVGMWEKVTQMEHGEDTILFQDYDKNGVGISGGELQKMAIARCLYTDSPFMVLDEPTAALDPKMEFRIYEQFNQLSVEKTVIYISHRLYICKLCDKILVFHKNQLEQTGTHEELLKQKNGLYAQLWNAQAQYYQ